MARALTGVRYGSAKSLLLAAGCKGRQMGGQCTFTGRTTSGNLPAIAIGSCELLLVLVLSAPEKAKPNQKSEAMNVHFPPTLAPSISGPLFIDTQCKLRSGYNKNAKHIWYYRFDYSSAGPFLQCAHYGSASSQ